MSFRIAVVGSGAIGLYYGGKLAAAGHDVHFLVRGDPEEFRRNGIRLTASDEDLHVPKVTCATRTDQIGPSDIVLVAVKTTSNSALRELLPPLIHDRTVLLTLQNGLGNEEVLAQYAGAERVMGGLCFICLTRRSRTIVERADDGHLSLGEFHRPSLAPTSEIVTMFEKSGVTCRRVENLLLERWRKLLWNIPFNSLSILGGGISTADILGDGNLHAATLALMKEVIQVAASDGCSLGEDDIAEQFRRTETMGRYKPSTLLDYEARRPLEIDPIWGEPLRRARKAGVPAPRLELLNALLRAIDEKNRA